MLISIRRFCAGFWKGAKAVVDGLYRHDGLGLAAQVAYSTLFSLFPFLLFLSALTAYIPATADLGDWVLGGLGDLVGTDSLLYQIMDENVFNLVGATNATLLSVGLVLTLWSASGAVMTLIKAVNLAYGLKETRSWFHRRPMAAGLAVAGAILIPAGILLLVFGSWLGDVIGREFGYDSLLHSLWVGFRWPVVFVLLVGVLGAFFYLAPSVRQKWYSVLPGALFAVGAIIGASVGLSWFLSQSVFQVRWLTYGVIGTAIVLLFWAFLMGLMVLAGGEINAAVRSAVAARSAAADTGAEKSAGEGLVESADDE
ncbi:MAG: YihY/virulence factor BrkB family protein [Thermoleophilia bacterium]|nr:YihY/virulence factor BrkB family protein [Thermoleophilia bacterium]